MQVCTLWFPLVKHQVSHSWPMERTDSPPVVKVEEHSQYVILTYFHGDADSMVDAHFARALNNVCKVKAPAGKAKKPRKTIKSEVGSTCQASASDSFSESQPGLGGGHLLTYNPADTSPGSWHSYSSRTVDNPGMSSITYSLSQEGLSLTGQQYASSLLNLLHGERGEVAPSVASCSKPELLPSWPIPSGFREPVDPSAGYDPGRRLEKKDLYWYWGEEHNSSRERKTSTTAYPLSLLQYIFLGVFLLPTGLWKQSMEISGVFIACPTLSSVKWPQYLSMF